MARKRKNARLPHRKSGRSIDGRDGRMVIALSGWTRRAGAPRRCWLLRGSSGQSRRLHRLWRSLAGGDRRAPSFRSSDGQREARSNRGGRRYPPCRGPNKMDKILFVYRKKPQGVSGCSSGIPSADSPLRVGRSVHIPRTRARQTSVARRPLRPARETRPSALDALVQDRLFGTMPPEGIALRLPMRVLQCRVRHGPPAARSACQPSERGISQPWRVRRVAGAKGLLAAAILR